MARKRPKLGEILMRWGQLTQEQLDQALKVAEGSRRRIGEALIELGFVPEESVTKALANQLGFEFIDLNDPDAIKQENLKLLPDDLIKKHLVLPLSRENGRLKVLIHDPMDLETLDSLRFRMNCEIDTALAPKSKIQEYLDEILKETKESIDKAVREMTVDATRDQTVDASVDMRAKGLTVDGKGRSVDARGKTLDVRGKTIDKRGRDEESNQAPIIRLVNRVISEAVMGRASDIHVEPLADRVRLRYRVDGVCHEQDPMPKRTQAAVTARLKIMAGLRIEEKRVPQDGRIKMKINDEKVDFRVSACPTYHGESIVLRILRPEAAKVGLLSLGLRDDTLESFNHVISRPNGIFLVTGPTGSGKTTTLYSALDVLNRPDRKIITAEDPIEYNFDGINQCQVNNDIGLGFSQILRAMLRQAPNIVLVGEIRDKEVAEVAIQAALTGHLVFSTLHTNDAPSSITRLIDMGVKPFLVASSIQAVLGQRLIRVLCPKCKTPDENPSPRQMRLLGFTPGDLEGQTVYKPRGCDRCGGTGYRGRKGIYEMMIMNNELRGLAFKRAPVNQIRDAAIRSGMRSLLGDGKLKILDGMTSMAEISRITQVEGVVDIDEEEEDLAVV